jgi:hypothetical protein
MTTKIRDLQIQDDIMEIIDCEVKSILARTQKGQQNEKDIVILEKLAKTYAAVMASHRQNIEYGVYGDTNNDLEESGDRSSDTDNTADGDDDSD